MKIMDKEIKKYCINSKCSIHEALQQLSDIGEKTLTVINNKSKLIGTLSDGDIRKAILKGANINFNINKIFNPKPFFLYEKNKISEKELKSIFIKQRYDSIAIVNNDKDIKKLIFWRDIFKKKNLKSLKNISVIIMSGGKGKRLEPFSSVLPKPLVPIHGKTIIEHIIDNFTKNHVSNFYITLNYKKNIIKSYLNEIYGNKKINFIEEKKFEGTAGSMKYLKKYKIQKPFILTNCDIILKSNYKEIYDWHIHNQNDLTLVTTLINYQIPYGSCDIDKDGNLVKINEKPKYNYLVNTGFYVISPSCLKHVKFKNKLDMPNLIKRCIENKMKVSVFPVAQNDWVDVGQWVEYKKAINLMDN